jgi:hypothetical protein
MIRNNLNLHPGELIYQQPLYGSNIAPQHHTEEEEMNTIHTSDTQPETITNHNSAISPSNIIKKVKNQPKIFISQWKFF